MAMFQEKLQQERRNLPIYPAKGKIINQIQRLDTAILIGETGSGKTTQIPQYLLEANVNKNAIIAITQPRRVAAITISQRVAEEQGTELGQRVGYCVRFEDVTSENTKIKYMTDGMLLREAILDPLLKSPLPHATHIFVLVNKDISLFGLGSILCTCRCLVV
ncbi:ATP-dependent RNA helicase DHX33-like [Ostrea edulis]|uniref:ATP-dependent RNA helicase DHX33-like n=1 Tax=Ostrea edulis TaxID=37623 RepID=UPI0024AF5951|nr:ATP-dependent RNA helicase DHX33-like [Ostrea edulis]